MNQKRKYLELNCCKCFTDFTRRNDYSGQKIYCRPCAMKDAGERRKGKYKLLPHVKQAMLDAKRKKYPNLTICCEFCHKNFVISYGRRHKAKYCSRLCQFAGNSKNRVKKDSRKNQKCIICSTEFKSYASKLTCSRNCFSTYMSKMRVGDGNPNWISRENLSKSKCPTCDTVFSYSRINLHKGQKRLFCSLKCSRKVGGGKHISESVKEKCHLTSEKSTQDITYNTSPYPTIWNDELKSSIKKRDNNCCQLCESKNKLEIHHKDDDKLNCEESNLITLCKKCHNITKHNRPFWQQLFSGLDSNSKIVKKEWGLEIHFVNNEKYCLKYLVFFKDRQFSLHTHKLKQELFFCNWGKFECYMKDGDREDFFIFKRGDKLEIMPGVQHQLQALTNCILTEVSTPDYPEDSIRIEPGIN